MHIYIFKEYGIRIIFFLFMCIVFKVVLALITCIREGIAIIFIITAVIRQHFYGVCYIYSVFFNLYNLLNFIKFCSIRQCYWRRWLTIKNIYIAFFRGSAHYSILFTNSSSLSNTRYRLVAIIKNTSID